MEGNVKEGEGIKEAGKGEEGKEGETRGVGRGRRNGRKRGNKRGREQKASKNNLKFLLSIFVTI